MKKILLLTFFAFLVNVVALSQTYCYQFLYNVDNNGMKTKNIWAKDGDCFYFTFSSNKSWCYYTDKDGIYTQSDGHGTYEYIGKENNMLIYEERNSRKFGIGHSPNILYFSPDYSRLNWRHYLDGDPRNENSAQPLRVLQYIKDPSQIKKSNTPSQLY